MRRSIPLAASLSALRPARLAPRALIAAAALTTAGSALAQRVTIDCFAPIDCRQATQSLLTEKFVAKFPPTRFKLVVFGSIHRYSDVTGAAYTVAGVSRRVWIQRVEQTLLPLKRYSASVPIETSSPTTEAQRKAALEQAVRAAVQRLMAVCEQTPDCAVHKPYD